MLIAVIALKSEIMQVKPFYICVLFCKKNGNLSLENNLVQYSLLHTLYWQLKLENNLPTLCPASFFKT